MAVPRKANGATFVLVHGAWAGGWAWTRVADRLTAKGHRVIAPTLSGLGERSHLAAGVIDLTTHVNDVVGEFKWKDLDRVVLVGHSYGGFVITGAAERVGERVASIVYVDAFIPEDGKSFVDLAEGWEFGGAQVPPPPTSEGDYFRETDRAWVDAKATPQPTATFTERLRVTGAYQRVPRKTFVRATGWDGPFAETVNALRSEPGWTVHEVACGHDIAIDMPEDLAAILEASI
jgi:pimeloyl-ACP methyl ester carboxylesterase